MRQFRAEQRADYSTIRQQSLRDREAVASCNDLAPGSGHLLSVVRIISI
uniref:Uncharacterized protein n=1 Tax=Ciona intestinalis TaxID=7719 RepID=H2Y2G0_CIOIN